MFDLNCTFFLIDCHPCYLTVSVFIPSTHHLCMKYTVFDSKHEVHLVCNLFVYNLFVYILLHNVLFMYYIIISSVCAM